MNKNKPDNVQEFNYEAVTILMNDETQVLITLEPVGATTMYAIHKCARTRAKVDRESASGPAKLTPSGMCSYYGAALRTARNLVGWQWEPHPSVTEYGHDR